MPSLCRKVSHESPDAGLTPAVRLLSGAMQHKAAMTRAAFRSALLLIVATATTTPARADDDHDDVRGAWIRGEIVGLSEILPGLEAQTGARLIDAELEHWHGRMVYEIVMITPDGRLMGLVVDATTGEITDGRGYRWGRHGGEDDDRPGRNGERGD